MDYTETKIMAVLETVFGNPGFIVMNKLKNYIRFSIGFCLHFYLTAGGEGMVKELILDKLRVIGKASNYGFQLNWKVESRIFDLLSVFTIDLKHIPRPAFFQSNVT